MGTQSFGGTPSGGEHRSHRDVHFLQHGHGSSMQSLAYRTSMGRTRRSRSTGGSTTSPSITRPSTPPAAGGGGGGGAGGGGGVTDPNAPVNSDTNYKVDPKGPDTTVGGSPADAGGLTPSVVPEPAALAIWSIAGIALVAATRRASRSAE